MRDYSDEIVYQKRRRRTRIFLAVFVFFSLTLLGSAGYVLFFTDLLIFKEISVEGLKRLSRDELFPPGARMYVFQPVKLGNPVLKNWTIKRDILNRRLTVYAEEREPYAIWCGLLFTSRKTEDGEVRDTSRNCYWFDKEGVLFAAAPYTEGTLIKEV